MPPRSWGWWTKHKLQILEDYLQAFAQASNKVDERIYLDLFAGCPENVSRETSEEILGSVHRALAAIPPFTQVRLFELPAKAAKLQAALRQRYPDRPEIRVHPGDCNESISIALADLGRVRWAPTFAFIDQQATEVHWSTLQQIASFRRSKNPVTKAEMWILFGTSFLPRGLRVGAEQIDAEFGDRMTAMFGSEDWIPIIDARRRGALNAARMRQELVNLMRWRLENVLGYKASHPFTMLNTNGQEIYQMIFTSDHPAGDRIMRQIYGKAAAQHKAMRQHALSLRKVQRMQKKDAQVGAATLFDVSPSMIPAPDLVNLSNDDIYSHEPPREPYNSS